MKERPIHFKQPVADAQIRAILEGRKTQTRLVVKDVGPDNWLAGASNHVVHALDKCPYGQPGDRLWVRETFMGPLIEDVGDYPDGYWSPEFCEYRADGGAEPEWVDVDGETHQGWKPSIHMPRWASRITLEITAIRVERLQDISEGDAKAEGFINNYRSLPFSHVGAVGTCAKNHFRYMAGNIRL